jgi:hypothetical protein
MRYFVFFIISVIPPPLDLCVLFGIMTPVQIFLMVSQIFASALSAIDRHSVEEQQAILEYHLAPYETFIRELWWDVAHNPTSDDLSAAHLTGPALIQAQQRMEKSEAEDQAVLRDLLMGMVNDSYTLLSELFHLGERGLTSRLSAEYVARYVSGHVHCSGQDVVISF